MPRAFLALMLVLVCGGAVAKDVEGVSYPLPADTPVEYIRDVQNVRVLPHPNYGEQQGTLAGAIIGNWMLDNEKSVAPIFAQLAPAKLDEYFLQAVLARLPEFLPSARLSVVPVPWTPEEILDKTVDSKGLYVALRSYHAFTLNMDAVGGYVELFVVRAGRGANGKLKETVLEHKTFSFEQHFQGWRSGMARGSATPWRALGGQAVEAAFRESIDQAINMLAYHASAEGQAEAKLKNRKHDEKVHGLKVPGRLVRTGPDWFWFREKYQDQLVGYGIIETPTSAQTPGDHAAP